MGRWISLKTIAGLSLACLIILGLLVTGSLAFWSDVEPSDANHLGAGFLDLECLVSGSYSGGSSFYSVTPGDNGMSGKVVFEKITPGQSGSIEWVLSNAGSIPGDLSIISTLTFTDGDPAVEPESLFMANNTDGNGDLDQYMMVILKRGVGENQASAESVLSCILGTEEIPVPISELSTYSNWEGAHLDAAGSSQDTAVYWLSWFLYDDENINIVQGDTAEIDLVFRLIQSGESS